jgi:3-deoxy-D-manno-octulosonic-acid transferase
MLRLLYNSLIYVAAPIAFGATVWRGLRDPAYRERRSERLGFGKPMTSAQTIWVHAVSVGEVQAAAALIRALLERYPQRQIVVTTGTPTGAQRVQAMFGDRVQHIFLP